MSEWSVTRDTFYSKLISLKFLYLKEMYHLFICKGTIDSSTFPDPGVEPRSPVLYADALPFEPPGKSSI